MPGALARGNPLAEDICLLVAGRRLFKIRKKYEKDKLKMTNKNYLRDDPFSDVKFLSDDFNARPGVYVPYDFALMYPSGQMP